MKKPNLKRQDFYKHAAYRSIIYAVMLVFLASIVPSASEYIEVYKHMAIFLIVAELVTLAVDYIFLWK